MPQQTHHGDDIKEYVNRDRGSIPIPVIVIGTSDNAGPGVDHNHRGLGHLDKRVDHSNRADFERTPWQSHSSKAQPAEEPVVTDKSADSIEEPQADLRPVVWNQYIYEPAIVAPLRCQVNGQRLGILLTRGTTGAGDSALFHLHYPSLVALDNQDNLQLATITKYVRISAHLKQISQWGP